MWLAPDRCYLVAKQDQMQRLEKLVGHEVLHVVLLSGGKMLVTNRAMEGAAHL